MTSPVEETSGRRYTSKSYFCFDTDTSTSRVLLPISEPVLSIESWNTGSWGDWDSVRLLRPERWRHGFLHEGKLEYYWAKKMLLHSKERYSDLHNFILGQWLLAQEAHGDWFAVEHNSAVADNLSQKYGKTKMRLCAWYYIWILCQQCLKQKSVYTTVLCQLKLASFLKPLLQEYR